MKHLSSFSSLLFQILVVLLLSATGIAQQIGIPIDAWREAGLPYITNFSPKDYKGDPQNWGIAQDEKGILYFANGRGVLIYDGVSWRLIKTPNETMVRSLLFANGKIYAGGQGELGYLGVDSIGQLAFISLLDHLPQENRDFKGVWEISALKDAIYFRTYNYLFRRADGQFKVWRPAKGLFHGIFTIGDTFYIREVLAGLMKMQGDSLHLIPGSEIFEDEPLDVMLPYDAGKILIGSRSKGFFLFDGVSFSPFPTPADAYLRKTRLYKGIVLPDGLLAFSTLRGGIAIADKSGNIYQVLDKARGLRDGRVYALHRDSQGALWLGLNNGIARVETPSPLSRFTAALGIENTVESIIRHRGKIFAATHLGVYSLEPRANGTAISQFKPVNGITTFSWHLLTVGDQLLAGTHRGVYQITEKGATLTPAQLPGAKYLCESRKFPGLIFAGLYDGLAAFRFRNNRWVDLGLFEGVSSYIINIVEDADGTLWLGTKNNGVLKIELEASGIINRVSDIQTRITRFGPEQGLPAKPVRVANVDGRIFFATQKGVHRFDSAKEVFIPDTTFGARFANPFCEISQLHSNNSGDVWIIGKQNEQPFCGKAVRQTNGTYIWQDIPFRRLNDLGEITAVYPEEDAGYSETGAPKANRAIWFGGSEGIARFLPDIPKDYAVDFDTAIRRVIMAGDSVIYGGASISLSMTSPLIPLQRGNGQTPPFEGGPGGMSPTLPYQNNSLRFEFAALSYDDPAANRFQYKLDGFDETWSNWTSEPQKDYTGLSEGDYIFRVRAKNIYGHTGSEARFEFAIKSPWYRAWWAYLLYSLLAGGIIAGLVQLRVRQLKRKSKELEIVVAERTVQVVEQRNRLKAQSEKLQEMDTLKSRFFANISYEFRTPLTLILGLVDKFKDKTENQADLVDYKIIQRNANRLLQLINQLLDLSKLEAGSTKLQASRQDIVSFVRRHLVSFASFGEKQQIQLSFNGAPPETEVGRSTIFVYFDLDKMEKIFTNLFSNAFKFTPKGGTISVSVAVVSSSFLTATTTIKENQYVEVKISNTGPGISKEKLPYIFDRFYQADDGATRQFEGSGIGLALVKELVELHKGKITAESEVEKETVFTLHLPLGLSHLKPDEIAAKEMITTGDPDSETFSIPLEDFVEETTLTSVTQKTKRANGEPKPAGNDSPDETLVLVVEDHVDLRDFIRKNLEVDYKIIEAENGVIGLEKAEETIPDLVVSDVMMPEMDGYQLCKSLKNNTKTNHIPIILLTAKAAAEDKLEGLETGADDYLVKPFNSDELRARVKNLIRSRQQMREKFGVELLLKPKQVTVPSSQKIFLERLTAIIESHIADENFSVEQLGGEMGMSRAQIHRKLRAITDQSASEFVCNFRLQRAAELIKQDSGNIAEIAYQVGFNSQAYFTRCFHEAFGCSPLEYKRKEIS